MSKPGACHHLSFPLSPVLSYLYENIFLTQFDTLVPNYSEGGYFLKMKPILALTIIISITLGNKGTEK